MSFKEHYYIDGVDEIVVRVPVAALSPSVLTVLNEGRWIASGKQDWMIRIDPADPSIPLLRHVHIARSKHISAKNQQASWNEDKTRHDRGTFNASVGSLRVVQDLARAALGLDAHAILEHVAPQGSALLESAGCSLISTVYLVWADTQPI